MYILYFFRAHHALLHVVFVVLLLLHLQEFVNIFCRTFHDNNNNPLNNSLSLTSPSTATQHFNEFELQELRDAFATLDGDHDNFLSAKDLQASFAALGEQWPLEKIKAMIREVDSTGKGAIRMADFIATLAP